MFDQLKYKVGDVVKIKGSNILLTVQYRRWYNNTYDLIYEVNGKFKIKRDIPENVIKLYNQ